MTIQYAAPLGRAWDRMVAALFRPFDLTKWLGLGFTCFLARLMQISGGASFSGGGSSSDNDEPLETPLEMAEHFAEGWNWLIGLGLSAIVIGLLLAVLAVLAVFLWLGSRGQLMFLDNVLANRAEVKTPWNEFRAEGNALFRWRLAYLAIAITISVLSASPLIWAGLAFGDQPEVILPLLLAGLGLLMFLILAVIVIEVLLLDFVVPIMHRERLSPGQAWRVFLPLLKKHAPSFVLYLLIILGLWILFLALSFVVCLLTCCLAGILLVLPYVSTVVLLPLYVTLRWYSLEFLAQLWPQLELPPMADYRAVPATGKGA